ncbi:VOC family protein [Cellulosilyticum sp. I15G10I2]|uniref:VOC family protein n=1 Tax=Cellulosilyticum sp. I15G10I2 TaxID=1892843 RepID=UPI00085BBAF4|nr:VOC family protein [Cellulosilyticum sp. I15G10I2]
MSSIRLGLTTIWTENVNSMKKFYTNVLGIAIKQDLEKYVEFEDKGICLAICERELMKEYSKDYGSVRQGQSFQISFMCDNEAEIQYIYDKAIKEGGAGIQPPVYTSPHQIAALFGDPDGNIHEIYANI